MPIFSSQTKTNSFRGSTRKRRVVVILASGVLGVCALVFGGSIVGTAAGTIVTPIVVFRTWLMESTATVPLYLRTQSALIDEVRSLENQLELRVDDAFTVLALKQENEELRSELMLPPSQFIQAGVLLRPDVIPYDTLLIDRGTNDGVLLDALVYVGEQIAIGSVAAVYPRSALVRLVSTPGIESTVYIYGPNIFTDAEGLGGGTLRVAVPQGIPLAVGNIVILPGIGMGAYGTVVSVESLAESPYQYGYVSSPIPLSSIRAVRVSQSIPPTVSFIDAKQAIENASSTSFHIVVPDAVRVGTTTPPTTQ